MTADGQISHFLNASPAQPLAALQRGLRTTAAAASVEAAALVASRASVSEQAMS